MADIIQSFIKELAFEEALTHHLLGHGWNEVIMNPTEEQLVENWARIIYDCNREIDKLGNHPLTASEHQSEPNMNRLTECNCNQGSEPEPLRLHNQRHLQLHL